MRKRAEQAWRLRWFGLWLRSSEGVRSISVGCKVQWARMAARPRLMRWKGTSAMQALLRSQDSG